MAKQFGAQVKLSVDKSNSEQINKQVADMIKKANLQVDTTQDSLQALSNKIQRKLDDRKFQISLTVKSIDAKTAIGNVRNQLQGMIRALSIDNGVSISGIKDFVGADGIEAGIRDAADALKEMADRAAEANDRANDLAGRIKALKELSKGLDKSYGSLLGDKNILSGSAEDVARQTEELSEVTKAYSEVSGDLERIIAGGVGADAKEIESISGRLLDVYERIQAFRQSAAPFEATEDVRGKMSAIEQMLSGVRSAYKQMLKDQNLFNESLDQTEISGLAGTDLDAITQKFTELEGAVRKYGSSAENSSDDALAKIQQESTEILRLITRYREAAKAKADEYAASRKNSDDEIASLKERIALQTKITKFANSNSKIMSSRQGVAINSMLSQLSSGADITKGKLREINDEFSKIVLNTVRTKTAGRTFWESVARMYEKFGGWTLITRTLGAALQKFKEMITNVRELDTAMTELKKVTDETSSKYNQFFEEATRRARDLGATVADTISASADMARLGYNMIDAAAMADAALVYKNVGDGISDVAEASESIISTMQAFKVEASGAMGIVDKFNEIGNRFPISATGIGEALLRSASAMAAANNTLDETIALITAANSVVQNPESVGKFMPNGTVMCRRKIAISVKSRRRSRPRKDFVVNVRKVRSFAKYVWTTELGHDIIYLR